MGLVHGERWLRRPDKRKETMTERIGRVRSRRGLTLLALVLVAAGVSAAVAVVTGTSNAGTTKASASRPTVYMVGSVTNNTFWAAVKRGFVDGGRTFGLRAIYSAPGVHSSA